MGLLQRFRSASKKKRSALVWAGETQSRTESGKETTGAIKHRIATDVAKLKPIVTQTTKGGRKEAEHQLNGILNGRWCKEVSQYDAMYKMASQAVEQGNAFALIAYKDGFTKVKEIMPITANTYSIFEDEAGNIFLKFDWEYDGKSYTVPYNQVIHIRGRYNKERFLGTETEKETKRTLQLIGETEKALEDYAKRGTGIIGYLKYANIIDEEELQKKVQEFQTAYMAAGSGNAVAGLDNTMDFKEISVNANSIPIENSEFLRENLYRYFGVNEKILDGSAGSGEWLAFYENVIEPIAIQMEQEFSDKLLTKREREQGYRIEFKANRLQHANLETRATIGADAFDRGAITVNELRELLYYSPVEGGDKRMISLNYVNADKQDEYQLGKKGGE